MTETDLRAAFEQVVRGQGSRDALLDSVRHFVRTLKHEGTSPEQVVVTVKKICGMSLAPFARNAGLTVGADVARSVSESVINAAIKEYFSGPVLERASRL